MQPTICARCKKNVAIIFITKLENGQTVNEGLCLKCARELHIKPVDDIIGKMGLTDDELDGLSSEMMEAFGGAEGLMEIEDGGEDEGEDEDGKTATFPFLNRLFGGPQGQGPSGKPGEPPQRPARETKEGRPAKRKFLDNYCICLTDRAKNGQLDRMVGREQELERVIQIRYRRQENNPCLIGEPGVG